MVENFIPQLIAIIGNSLVMYVVLVSRRMQTVTNFYIANLALCHHFIARLPRPSLNLPSGQAILYSALPVFVFVFAFAFSFFVFLYFLTKKGNFTGALCSGLIWREV